MGTFGHHVIKAKMQPDTDFWFRVQTNNTNNNIHRGRPKCALYALFHTCAYFQFLTARLIQLIFYGSNVPLFPRLPEEPSTSIWPLQRNMCPYSPTSYDISRLRIGRDGHLDQSEAYDIS